MENTSLWSASLTLTPTVIQGRPGSSQTCALSAFAVFCSRLRETHPTDLAADQRSTGPTRPLITIAFDEMMRQRVSLTKMQDPPPGGRMSVGGRAPRPLPMNPCAKDKDTPSPPDKLIRTFATDKGLYVFVTTRVMHRL